ncbi:UNVERIFIED_CONTAM: hypothetical protein Scaly_2962900 [Sesamum calycinum]|uniref:Uncharacterized protein n=1 Tax=Sesamum calycinum TaxID=2727403 RepID=A0AAW2KM26_9LAMI
MSSSCSPRNLHWLRFYDLAFDLDHHDLRLKEILDLDLLDSTSLFEVWEMPKLRNFSVYNGRLPDPVEGQDSTILADLSTLEDIAFPTSLKKLSLTYYGFSWENMTIIGSSLPNLEVLKLDNTGEGAEWSPIEREFLRLKVLVIESHDLEQWEVEDIHFSNLHGFYLRSMSRLKEIPLSIGDINTLQSIHLIFCLESAMISAIEIVKDQKEKRNKSLQVYVNLKQVFSYSNVNSLTLDW